jgi:hypothetical protein
MASNNNSGAPAPAPAAAPAPTNGQAEAQDAARKGVHAELCKTARDVNCRTSVFDNGVSMHTLPATVSFANLAKLHRTAVDGGKRTPQTDYLATAGSDLVFSSNFKRAATMQQAADAEVANSSSKHRKRRRDDREDQAVRVDQARNRLSKCFPDLPASELDAARTVLVNLVNDLRGASNEVVVQSFALLAKKLHTSDAKPRVLIAVRLNAGIAVPLALLKRCLGPCWSDGAVTTEDSVSSVSDADMPLSEEARAARDFGNLPLMVVTSAPRTDPS